MTRSNRNGIAAILVFVYCLATVIRLFIGLCYAKRIASERRIWWCCPGAHRVLYRPGLSLWNLAKPEMGQDRGDCHPRAQCLARPAGYPFHFNFRGKDGAFIGRLGRSRRNRFAALASDAKQHRVSKQAPTDRPFFLNPNSLLSAGLLGLLLIAYIAAVYVTVVALGTLPFGERPSDSLMPLDQRWHLNFIAFILLALTIVPVSRWLSRRVNDLVYAEHDNPYALAAAINQRLQTMSNPHRTLPLVVETIATTLHLPYVNIEYLYLNATEPAVYGTVPEYTQTWQFPIQYLDHRLGLLSTADRAAGRPLTDSDRLILAEIAQQIGVALYVSQLTADLQVSRERLIVSREEERRRLRNDLHDGLAPTLSSFQLQLSAIRTLMQQNPPEAEK